MFLFLVYRTLKSFSDTVYMSHSFGYWFIIFSECFLSIRTLGASDGHKNVPFYTDVPFYSTQMF